VSLNPYREDLEDVCNFAKQMSSGLFFSPRRFFPCRQLAAAQAIASRSKAESHPVNSGS